jgi:phospholipid/cholesterol/gamma-HCH transport system permease protein
MQNVVIFGASGHGSVVLDCIEKEAKFKVQESLMMSHIVVGLLKGLLFGLLIGIAGCRAGMQATRNSEGVGRATTNAVVTALIYLVVADAAINIVCQWLEI